MSYDYYHEDEDKGRFYANTWTKGGDIRIQVEYPNGKDGRAVHKIKPSEAPAVALAILEAAGIGTGNYLPGEMRDLDHIAVDALRRWKKEQDAKAEREAEDAKVREYLNAAKGTNSYDHYRITDYDRAEYKRVQEFFQEEQ